MPFGYELFIVMEKCFTIEDGVNSALSLYEFKSDVKWKYIPRPDGEYTDFVMINGVNYPLFWWRNDSQIAYIIASAPSKKPVSMKLNEECAQSYGLDALAYKNFDIFETSLKTEAESVMCFKKTKSLNMIVTAVNKRVGVFELAAVLKDGTKPQGRHSVWGEVGMCSTRVVSQKVDTQAIYQFTDDSITPVTYNDEFIYMYGLEKDDVAKASLIAEMLMGRVDYSDWISRDAKYKKYLAAMNKSTETCERVLVKGVE